MARLNDEFLMAWSSLCGEGGDEGWQTIAVTPSGPLELKAGRRAPDNSEALLVGFPAGRLAFAAKLPEGQGFVVQRVHLDDNEMLWLALTRKSAGSKDLFCDMACNVTGALDDAVAASADVDKLLRVFIGRVGAWQEFMRRGSQALSPEVEIGLVGELATLLQVIKDGVAVAVAVEGWLGPLDGVQDFELGVGALEVKATLSSAGFPAHIGSLEQLDDAVRRPLFIVGLRLRQTEGGLDLPGFVAAVRSAAQEDLRAASALDDRLVAAGYFDAHVDRYPRRFTVAGTLVIEVGDGFPRLTIGRVPAGVNKAAYDIDLEKAPGRRVDVAIALKTMGAV